MLVEGTSEVTWPSLLLEDIHLLTLEQVSHGLLWLYWKIYVLWAPVPVLHCSCREKSVWCWSDWGLRLLWILELTFFVEGELPMFLQAMMLTGFWGLAESNNWQQFQITCSKSHPAFLQLSLQLPPLISNLMPCTEWSRDGLIGVTPALSVR